LLLSPRLPLLFQGEEYGETNPFPYFCDFHNPELVEAVRKGRADEFRHFHRPKPPPDPVAPETRAMAVLSWAWDDPNRAALRRLYRDLLRFRRDEPGLRDFRPPVTHLLDAGDVLEFSRGEGGERLRIVFNLSGQERALPVELAAEGPIFRSEIAEYGADADAGDLRFTHLLPHEFQVFRQGEQGR
jgi:maltooligosyltrehalose trehalohydrolase